MHFMKPYSDPREQAVAPNLADDPQEQARRVDAIEAIGYLVERYGLAAVKAWTVAVPPHERIAPLVEDFGPELVGKWMRYFAWKEGQR